MSVLTAIFQALGQALSWVLPISESGHSAIFHNFSGRFTDACSQLTGVVHIGIAFGIFIAFIKLFIILFKNFFAAWGDIFHKRLDVKNVKPARSFMYMTFLSPVPMLLYFIPVGGGKNIYSALHSLSYNTTLLDEGVFMALSAAMLLLLPVLSGRVKPVRPALQAAVIGVFAFFAVPVAGLSPAAAVLFAAVLSGLGEKNAVRYFAVLSVVILPVMGGAELITAVTKVSVSSAVLAFVFSAAAAFFFSRLLSFVVKNKALKYFGIYDAAAAVICLVTGIFQIVLK